VGDGGEEGVLEVARLAQALRVLLQLGRAALEVGDLGLEPFLLVRVVERDEPSGPPRSR